MKSPLTLFTESCAFYKTHFALLCSIVLMPVAVDAYSSMLSLGNVGSMLSFAVSIYAYIALITAIDNPSVARTVQHSYRLSTSSFLRYLVVVLITESLVVIGMLALLLPGFLFIVWFLCAPFVVVLEKRDIFDSIRQSREYARGQWTPIFGRLIALCFIIFVSVIIAAFFFVLTNFGEMGMYFFSWLITPFIYIYLYLLYKEIKQGYEHEK